MASRRLVFFGTPSYSVDVLRAVVGAGHEVVLVVTQPDRKRGRGSALSPSPVKAAATELGIPVTHQMNDVLDVKVDLGVLVAFGRIIKSELLRHVTILNIHPSLLPRWRGATPAEGAILAGDTRTGVCVMKLEEEMDAGPVYARAETQIGENETSVELYNRLYVLGIDLLLKQLNEGPSTPETQVGEPTYCGKLSSEDFHIDWTQSAEAITRLTRIGKPWTSFRGKRLLILQARVAGASAGVGADANPQASQTVQTNPAEEVTEIVEVTVGQVTENGVITGNGMLELLTVQPEGKAPMDAVSWLNGARPSSSDLLK